MVACLKHRYYHRRKEDEIPILQLPIQLANVDTAHLSHLVF